MIYFEHGSKDTSLKKEDLEKGLYEALEKLGKKQRVFALPPDFTRYHSRAGELTEAAWKYYGDNLVDVMPALGTHVAMSDDEIRSMYGATPLDLFRVHDWRNDIETVGEVPSDYINEISEGKVKYPWPAQVNKMLVNGNHDLILSIGQVVPHEVAGFANYNKNIFVGTGGKEGINKSHFLGAAYGMERMMGRADTPVRKVLNYASDNFTNHLPLVYVLTVVGRGDDGNLHTRGLYIGDDVECFEHAAALSLEVNFQMLEQPLKKVVVFLDPGEFKSTWLGNKSVYRTRMALADEGELIVLAPGLKEFGEDKEIDRLIRKYGYRGTPNTLKMTDENEELQQNLSAAAHLIHGSSEDRFSITYCPGKLTKEEVEGVNFKYADLGDMMKKYNPDKMKDGFNEVDGEEIFYIPNPAIGLWAYREKFK